MSAFDPDTGLRLRPDDPGEGPVPSRQRNPFHLALTAIWATALLTLITGVFAASTVQAPTGPIVLAAAAAVGAMAGIAQLAAAAATWRPSDR